MPHAFDPSDPSSPSPDLLGELRWETLARYAAGDATRHETHEVDSWLTDRPDRHLLLDQLRQVWAAPMPIDAWEPHVADIKSHVLSAIAAQDAAATAADVPAHASRDRRRWLAWSGFGIATLALALVWIASGRDDIGALRPMTRMATYTTGNGQRATISLPDGSTVVLNVASRLEVPADYERGHRALRLTGEALFTVAHTDGTPFTVATGNQITRVLGTSFLVRRYADESHAVVAVRDGRVAVQATDGARGTAVLGARQQAVVSRSGSPAVTAADPAQFSFETGVLEFDDVSLQDAIPSLDRWYDVSIVLADPSLRVRRIVGGFRSGSVTDLVGTLELLFDVRAVRAGNTVTLYPK